MRNFIRNNEFLVLYNKMLEVFHNSPKLQSYHL